MHKFHNTWWWKDDLPHQINKLISPKMFPITFFVAMKKMLSGLLGRIGNWTEDCDAWDNPTTEHT